MPYTLIQQKRKILPQSFVLPEESVGRIHSPLQELVLEGEGGGANFFIFTSQFFPLW